MTRGKVILPALTWEGGYRTSGAFIVKGQIPVCASLLELKGVIEAVVVVVVFVP